MKKTLLLGVLALSVASASYAQIVAVSNFSRSFESRNNINTFYNSLSGVSSSFIGEISTTSLANVDLFWALQPQASYTGSELTAMADFLAMGGRIAFMGEHGTFAPNENNRINEALTFLGADVQIQNIVVDANFRTASVGDGQILNHPLTQGVDSYRYAAFAPLIPGTNTEVLMVGEEGSPPNIMMAFENIGPGSVFLITDQNVWDSGVYNSPNFDNDQMFENLLLGDTGAPPVMPPDPVVPPVTGPVIPEPSTIAFLGAGLLGLILVIRRRK